LVDCSQGSALDWEAKGRYACQLSRDVAVSKIEANLVFRQLNLARITGALKSWTVLVEEGHRFEGDP
jgi:hypothetical protein